MIFIGLQPGVSYTVTETQPGFFVDGKDTYPSGAISQTNDAPTRKQLEAIRAKIRSDQ